jgi:CRISPR-associated endonuclease/helicase Cas3
VRGDDEADFYDPFTQANLVVLLRALRLLEVPVLLMSATVPDSARELYAKSGFAPPRIHADTTTPTVSAVPSPGVARWKLRQRFRPAGACPGREPTIIYANTVRRAQAYHAWFRRKKFNPENLVLYHGRFTEPHKADIEDRLREMLGAAAWKAGTARGVAILTQIGELSVNISAD